MHDATSLPSRRFAVLLLAGLTACNASFDDLRSPPSGDRGIADASGRPERGVDVGGPPDGHPMGDGIPVDAVVDRVVPADAGQAGPISQGTFGGLNGYQVTGEATVERRSDGSFKLLFSSAFSASNGPALVVVMSDRATLGTIQTAQGDVRVAELKSNSGAQSYDLSAAAASRRFVWIFCEPFGVDFGKAELKVLP